MKPHRVHIRLGDHSVVFSEGMGSVWFEPVLDGLPGPAVRISNVLYVPALCSNLLSVLTLSVKHGIRVSIKNKEMVFTSGTGSTLFTATVGDNYAAMLNGRTLPNIPAPQAIYTAATAPLTRQLWHIRACHRNHDTVDKAHKSGAVTGKLIESPADSDSLCPACIAGKHSRLPFSPSVTRSSEPLQLVHTDLHGPMRTQTMSGKQYWIIFIDDYSRYRWIKFLCTKDEAYTAFLEYKAYAENQTGKTIKMLRDDKGGEFMSNQFDAYLKSSGIQRQHTTRATPQQNGVAERANRDIGEGVVTLLSQSGLPDCWWGEAANAFIYTTNCFPTRSIASGTTPHELWHKSKPSVAHLRTWGCIAYVHVQKDQRASKLAPHSQKCVFVGYGDG